MRQCMWHTGHSAWHIVRAVNDNLEKQPVHPLSSPPRPPGSSSPLMNTSSATTSSLESFIRSLGRCAHLLLLLPATPPPLPHPPGRVPGTSDLCRGEHLPRDSVSQGCQGSSFQPSLGRWGGAARCCSSMTSAPCVPRPLRRSSSVPTRRALPSWSSSNFLARRSNCRTLRGEH